jgi:hypothetical protein
MGGGIKFNLHVHVVETTFLIGFILILNYLVGSDKKFISTKKLMTATVVVLHICGALTKIAIILNVVNHFLS